MVSKLLKLCVRNGFFHSVLLSSDDLPRSLVHGPIGTLLRRNIKKEWLFSALNNPDADIFPLEIVNLKHSKPEKSPENSNSFFLPASVLQNYHRLPSFGYNNLEIGFASYGFGQFKCNSFPDSSRFKKLESNCSLLLTFFCPTKESADWFSYWSKYRCRWWRKYSSLASKFSISDVLKNEFGCQQMTIIMECPWGEENLETITLFSAEIVKGWITELGLEPHIDATTAIVCETELDLATVAFLANSFTEKWRNMEMQQLFQLNTKLAPYKVAIYLNTEDSDLKKLKDIANHLEKDLKKCEITLLPQFSVVVPHFAKLDAMGVPYTLVLDKKSLQSGVVRLRNRDSTLHEQIHISEVKSKLLKYLQMQYHITC